MYIFSWNYIKEKWQHAGFQKYLKNMSWAFLGKVYGLIGSFFVGILVARYLGPEKYGVLNYVLSFVVVLAFLANFGIDNILVRDLVKFKENKDKILNTAFSIKIIGAIIVIVITLITSLLIKNDGYTTTLIFLYSLNLIFSSINVLDYYFQSEVKYKYIFWAQIISVTAISILRLFLIYQKLGTGWFVVSLIFESLFYVGTLLFIFNKQHGQLSLKIDFSLAKKLIMDSWPFIFTTAFALIYSKIDQIMIGKMMDNHSLGIYAAGVKLAEIWYFVPATICGVVLPSIVSTYQTNLILYKNRIKKLLCFIVILTFLFALFEFIFAKFLITITFGSAYLAAAEILRIYTWAGIFIAIMITLNQELVIKNKTKLIMWSSFVGAIANVVLNYIFIPKFGIVGSAWATFFSYMLIPLIIYINKIKKE